MAKETQPPDEMTAPDSGTFNELNDRLADIAYEIYGDKARLRVVAPASVRLLKKNARYMKKATFDQLASNVGKDGMLSSVPLCHELPDGTLECLSGNHRIKAALKAGLLGVLVLVVPQQEGGRMIATQLSHNALTGEDDKQLLADLWASLPTLEHKLYSGLDSETVQELEKLKFTAFNAEQLRTERILLWFLPEEVEALDLLLAGFQEAAMSDPIYMAPAASYEKLFQALVRVKKVRNIKNTALALAKLIDMVHEQAMKLEETPAEKDGDE